MKQFTLMEVLEMGRKALLTEVNSSAGLFGKKCWFWPAEERCVSKMCLVAHVDTVWDTNRDGPVVYYDSNYGVYWSPDGLGADDRAGVWTVHDVREKTGCAVLLCDAEETGGQGAHEAVQLLGGVLQKYDFLAEVDRRGHAQAVYYHSVPAAFKEWVETFGFEQHIGSFSDISILGPALRRATVNLSAGYQNEHRINEYLVESALLHTRDALLQMVASGVGAEFAVAQERISRAIEARRAAEERKAAHEFAKFRKHRAARKQEDFDLHALFLEKVKEGVLEEEEEFPHGYRLADTNPNR